MRWATDRYSAQLYIPFAIQKEGIRRFSTSMGPRANIERKKECVPAKPAFQFSLWFYRFSLLFFIIICFVVAWLVSIVCTAILWLSIVCTTILFDINQLHCFSTINHFFQGYGAYIWTIVLVFVQLWVQCTELSCLKAICECTIWNLNFFIQRNHFSRILCMPWIPLCSVCITYLRIC